MKSVFLRIVLRSRLLSPVNTEILLVLTPGSFSTTSRTSAELFLCRSSLLQLRLWNAPGNRRGVEGSPVRLLVWEAVVWLLLPIFCNWGGGTTDAIVRPKNHISFK